MYTRSYTGKVNMVIFDIAGTICDGPQDLRHRWPQDDLRGCKAPVVPFYKVLSNHGMLMDWETIRKPMGTFKPDHLRLLMDLPESRDKYLAKYGHPYTEEEFHAILDEYMTLLLKYSIDDDLIRPTNGAADVINTLQMSEVIVGADTGYFASIANILLKKLEQTYNICFDVATNSENVQGRPSPFMIYDCMAKARIWPIESVVKVDDTAAGILSGNNAGCWTIALYESGSNDYENLKAAKPDFIVPNIMDVPRVIWEQINPMLRKGEKPGMART